MKVIACPVSDRIFKTINEVKKHVADKSIVFRDGKFLKGVRCDVSHVGFGRLTESDKVSK